MIILIEGNTRKIEGDISIEFERGITLTPIDKDGVCVFLEINKLINDDSFNTDGVMQKSYTIYSKKLL